MLLQLSQLRTRPPTPGSAAPPRPPPMGAARPPPPPSTSSPPPGGRLWDRRDATFHSEQITWRSAVNSCLPWMGNIYFHMSKKKLLINKTTFGIPLWYKNTVHWPILGDTNKKLCDLDIVRCSTLAHICLLYMLKNGNKHWILKETKYHTCTKP